MPDHTDNINLDNIVFDDQNFERRLWSCLGRTCSRSLIVFLSQFFVILLIICGSFWRIHLAKTCDESTVWVGILCNTAGYILPSPKLWTSYFLQNSIFISLVRPSDSGKTYLIHEWLKVGTIQPKFDKIYYINTLNHSVMSYKQKMINLSLFNVYTSNLSTLWKITVPYICSFLMTHVQKFATLRSLWTLLPLADIADLVLCTLNTKTQLIPPKQTRKGCWASKHTHCSFQVTSRCASGCYIECTVGAWISSRWLVSGCNVCTFWSFVDWFVSANRRSLTLLHK